MELTEDDISRIVQTLLDAGETVRKKSIRLDGKTLSFRVLGTDRDGHAAITALRKGGLNWYSDGDFETDENFTKHTQGAESSLVTMTLRDGGVWK